MAVEATGPLTVQIHLVQANPLLPSFLTRNWITGDIACPAAAANPALIITAEYDPLRDEGEAYAARLREAGFPAKAIRYQGVLHGFYLLTNLAEPSKQALEDTAAALRAVFEPEAGKGKQ